MMIKDTRVFQTFQLTVTLTEDAPEIGGYNGMLDVVTFRPSHLQIMWTSDNGKPWKVVEVRAKRWVGTETFMRTIKTNQLGLVPWVEEIVNETRPNTD